MYRQGTFVSYKFILMKKILITIVSLILTICIVNINTNKGNAEGENITSFKVKGRDNIIYMRQTNTTNIEFEVEPATAGQSISYTCTYYDGLTSATISTSDSTATEGPKLKFEALSSGGVGYAVIDVTLNNDLSFKQTVTVLVSDTQKVFETSDYVKGSGESYTLICNDEFNQFMQSTTSKYDGSYVKIKNKSTSEEKTLTFNSEYTVTEGCIEINIASSVMESLPVGTYSVEVKSNNLQTPATGEFVIKNPDAPAPKPEPEPQPKDESCEKVIGPSWHWNNTKGICEEYSTVGTYTR